MNNLNYLFNQFDTPFKRKKFYENRIGFIKPEKVLLKTSVCMATDNIDEVLTESKYGYFIPFEKSLVKTLTNLPETIDLNFKINKNLKNEFFDGTYVQSILNQKNMNLNLAIGLYCDEIELTNAVGASRTKHKLSSLNTFMYLR